ncbi:MAG: hypothetical protein WCE75_08665 [Terracidiphilus sp.]
MLKRLAILAALCPLAAVGILAGQDAPRRAPEQGTARAGNGQGGHQQASVEGSGQSAPDPPPFHPQHTPPPSDETCQQARQNLKIQGELALFTGLLVFVGLLQAGTMIWQARLLKQTREEVHTQAEWMKTQAGHMENQTKILGDSVASAQTSADAAKAQIQLVKDKERGRLRIEFGHVDLAGDPDPDAGYALPFRLILDGTSQVYITAHTCFAAIRESEDVPADPQWWRGMGLPATLTPEERSAKGTMTILTNEKPWGEPDFDAPDDRRVSLVREDTLHIFVRALIAYEDLFGGRWELRFNRKWRYYGDLATGGYDLSAGFWESIGDNGEYQSEFEKRPEPN